MREIIRSPKIRGKMSGYKIKTKKSLDTSGLARGRYWDTVRLNDGGVIRVVKSEKKVYPKGY